MSNEAVPQTDEPCVLGAIPGTGGFCAVSWVFLVADGFVVQVSAQLPVSIQS